METGSRSTPVLDYGTPGSRGEGWEGWRKISTGTCVLIWGAAFGLLGTLLLCRIIPAFGVWRIPVWVYLGMILGLVAQTRWPRAFGVPGGLWRGGLGLVVLLGVSLYVLSSNTRLRAELEHGITLPWSAHNLQCRGDAPTSFTDRAAVTWFEVDRADLDPFLARLSVVSRDGSWAEWSTGKGKPRRRVWVPHSASLGNVEYRGHVKTWSGQETPRHPLYCESPVGDFLIVEVLDKPGGGHVVKMYTDWN